MLSKKVFKDIQSLSHKKSREETGLFVAEGPKIVSELLQIAPGNVKDIYATNEWAQQHASVAHTQIVSDDELARLSFLKTPHQAVAVVQQFKPKVPIVNSIVLYLDTIQDPGNFGTIVRIADWFAIDSIVCTEGCADLYNPKVVQSTMGSIARVNLFYDNNHEWIKKQTAPKFAATLQGKSITEVGKINSGIIMIGNESKGLSTELISLADEGITIPKRGNAESLNAAVATGVILSHLT